MKQILSLILILVLAAVPLATVISAPPSGGISSLADMEAYLRKNFPFGEHLQDVAAELLLQSGQRERDGVFCTDDGLMANYWPQESTALREKNLQAIITFTENHNVPVGSVVVPTAVAVKQQTLPDNVPLYNQKDAIADINRAMEGKVTAADVYSALYHSYNESEEYLYCRTDSHLTALGGYRVYAAVADRLRLSPVSLREFSREYLVHGYYGPLTEAWDENHVDGDILSVYRNIRSEVQYHLVVTNREGTTWASADLYPTDRVEEDPFSIYLGGECASFELSNSGENQSGSLLVFGDSTVQTVLPFMTEHYGRITYRNLALLERRDLRDIDLNDYDQVLFLYGLETFCGSDDIQKVDAVR